MDIFNHKDSLLGSSIKQWCINNQTNHIAIELYAKYFSDNSARQISLRHWYFIKKNDNINPDNPTQYILKKDRKRKPKDIPIVYKIQLSKESSKKGSITIASSIHPTVLRRHIQRKNYGRPLKNGSVSKYILESRTNTAQNLGYYLDTLPDGQLFKLINLDVTDRCD